jgi:uncharacterized protein
MRIEFDYAKNRTNLQKHGVTLAAAERLEWDELQAIEDASQDYGEQRMIGYAPMGSRLYCVVYVDRGADRRRIISLRKANQREVDRYVQENR